MLLSCQTCVMLSSLNWLTLHGCASYLLCMFIFEVKQDIQLCCHGHPRFLRLWNLLLYMGVMSWALTGLHPSQNSLSQETIVIMKCTRCILISCRGSNKCICTTQRLALDSNIVLAIFEFSCVLWRSPQVTFVLGKSLLEAGSYIHRAGLYLRLYVNHLIKNWHEVVEPRVQHYSFIVSVADISQALNHMIQRDPDRIIYSADTSQLFHCASRAN